jgi:cytosine/adenosine deaminase-related metal-dependent hydrolase
MSDADLVLAARWILPVTSPPIRDGVVVVRQGRIAACGDAASFPPLVRERARQLGEVALLPGFVNVHAHLELTALRGYVEDTDFFAWIRKLTRTKYEVLDRDDLLVSSLWGALESTRAGVTTIGEVCDLGVSREAIERAGLRAVIFQEVFGPDPALADEKLAELQDRVAAHTTALRSARIRIGVSPHAPYSVSERLFRGVGDWAATLGLPVTIHAAESRAERAFVERGEGPFAEFLRGRGISCAARGVSTIRFLAATGILETSPLLVHCIDVDDCDLGLLRRHDAPIAHCPKSNAKLGHGAASLAAFRAQGLRIGIGTDSVASNNIGDLIDEARHAALLARIASPLGTDARSFPCPKGADPLELSARDVLALATIEGARALGLDAEIGSIEAGKQADLVALDLRGVHLEPVHDPEAAIVWGATAQDVVLSLVEGEVLYDHGRWSRLSEVDLRAALAVVTRKLDPGA